MRLVSTTQTSVSRFSLVVALLAAIAFASFQTAELSHQHMAGEGAENCVLCKTQTNEAALTGSVPTVFSGFNIALNCMLDNSSSFEHVSYQLARAPPHQS